MAVFFGMTALEQSLSGSSSTLGTSDNSVLILFVFRDTAVRYEDPNTQ